MEKSKPGVWESVVLLEDGSIDVEWMTIFDDGSAMHGDAIYQPGDGKFEDVMSRHANLQLGVVHKVQIPHEGKLEPIIDRSNEAEVKFLGNEVIVSIVRVSSGDDASKTD